MSSRTRPTVVGLAGRARFPVVDARVVHDATDRPGLLVERFDRVPYRDHSLAIPILGRTIGLSRLRLLEFAGRTGLPERAATRTLDQVLAAIEPVVAEWQDGALPFQPASSATSYAR